MFHDMPPLPPAPISLFWNLKRAWRQSTERHLSRTTTEISKCRLAEDAEEKSHRCHRDRPLSAIKRPGQDFCDYGLHYAIKDWASVQQKC